LRRFWASLLPSCYQIAFNDSPNPRTHLTQAFRHSSAKSLVPAAKERTTGLTYARLTAASALELAFSKPIDSSAQGDAAQNRLPRD